MWAPWVFTLPPFTFSSSASDDVESPDKIRTLLKDIREARQAKSREGLQKLDHSELSVSYISAHLSTWNS